MRRLNVQRNLAGPNLRGDFNKRQANWREKPQEVASIGIGITR
jgi:hypothetical protein